MDKQNFRQFDRLDTLLGRLLLELQFVISLVEGMPPAPLQIDSNAWLTVMTRYAKQLAEAQQNLRRLSDSLNN